MPDTKLEALIVQGADLIPLSALLSLPSGFYGGRWIDSDSIAALVEECVRMTPPQAEVQAEPVTDEKIKAAFLANGFTIKEGLTDLKPYVYQAARALLKLTAPQAQPADALTQAALDVLAERRRQVEAEGWTPERDDQYVHGDMASAAGCYAMFTQAYPKGDPHHSWPWDKAWWKPSKDARRNRVKACALLLAEIERLDRAAMAAAQEGGNAAKEA